MALQEFIECQACKCDKHNQWVSGNYMQVRRPEAKPQDGSKINKCLLVVFHLGSVYFLAQLLLSYNCTWACVNVEINIGYGTRVKQFSDLLTKGEA